MNSWLFEYLRHLPIEFMYAVIAIVGGCARYFNSFAEGKRPFRLSILMASAFVAGFSGMMFALLSDSMHLPYPFPPIFAGVGGFFGEQTLKYIMEYVTDKKMGTEKSI